MSTLKRNAAFRTHGVKSAQKNVCQKASGGVAFHHWLFFLIGSVLLDGVIAGPGVNRQLWRTRWRIDFHSDLSPFSVFVRIRGSVAKDVLIPEFDGDFCADVF